MNWKPDGSTKEAVAANAKAAVSRRSTSRRSTIGTRRIAELRNLDVSVIQTANDPPVRELETKIEQSAFGDLWTTQPLIQSSASGIPRR